MLEAVKICKIDTIEKCPYCNRFFPSSIDVAAEPTEIEDIIRKLQKKHQ